MVKRVLFILILQACLILTLFSQGFLGGQSKLIPQKNKKGKYGYVDIRGKKFINYQYDYAEKFSQGFATVIIDNYFFFIDEEGELLTKDTFDIAWPFQDYFALVMKNQKYAFIDTAGKVLRNQWFDKAWLMFDNYAEAKIANTNYLVSKQGQVMNYGRNKLPRANAEVLEITGNMPSFPGGTKYFNKYFINEFLRRRPDFKGKLNVNFSFIIERDGTITNVQVLNTSSSDLKGELLTVLNLMPPWIPGKQQGKPVRVQYNLPLQLTFE